MSRRIFASLAVLLFVLGACAAPVPKAAGPSPSTGFPVSVSDFQGRTVTVPKRPERIVSIGPSITEFLFALGAGDRIVGVDDFSDEPPAATKIEKLGGIKVNFERIVALQPEIVFILKLSDGTIERLAAIPLTVIVVDPQAISEVASTATLVGKAVGADGDRLAKDIGRQVDEVKATTAKAATRPRVYHEIDASDPTKIFTVGPGSYIHDLIGIAGGANIAANATSAYPQLSAEQIVKSDPEIVVLAASDYSPKPDQIAARPGWSQVTAVKARRIVALPANLVNRPGPRVGEAALAYAKAVHPELYR